MIVAASIASATIASTVLATAGSVSSPSPAKGQRDPNLNPILIPSLRPSSTPSSPNRSTLAQTITNFKSQRDPNPSSADSVQSNLTQSSSQKAGKVRGSSEGIGSGSEDYSLRLFLSAHLSLLSALFVQQGASATATASLTSGKQGQSRYASCQTE